MIAPPDHEATGSEKPVVFSEITNIRESDTPITKTVRSKRCRKLQIEHALGFRAKMWKYLNHEILLKAKASQCWRNFAHNRVLNPGSREMRVPACKFCRHDRNHVSPHITRNRSKSEGGIRTQSGRHAARQKILLATRLPHIHLRTTKDGVCQIVKNAATTRADGRKMKHRPPARANYYQQPQQIHPITINTEICTRRRDDNHIGVLYASNQPGKPAARKDPNRQVR